MLRRNRDREDEEFTPEELQRAIELDRIIDQIGGKETESGLVLDAETREWLSEMRGILSRIKESYEGYVDHIEPPREHRERTRERLIEEMNRLGLEKRSIWRRIKEGIHASRLTPQPVYRREVTSDMRVHEGEAARRGFILKVQLGGELIERELDEGEYVIGSSPQAHIRLADPNRYISRRHAKLIVRGGELFITDLGSTNGTFVNGRRIEPNEEVRVGTDDRIELADIPIEIHRQS
jgi:hypothetical protein